MLRLADREIDDRLARLDARDQVGQPHKGRPGLDRRSGWGRGLALCGHHGHAFTRRAPPAAQGFPYNKEGEVKTRLTIGNCSVSDEESAIS